MKHRVAKVATLLLGVLLALSMGQVALAQQGSYLSEYPVPGRPQSIAVEAPNRVWFTLPEENQIGRLVVTSPVSYTVTTYTVPTANSQPYDLKYAGGYIWFTERLGNKIGRLEVVSGNIAEYALPTSSAEPMGMDVLAGSVTNVWFAERAENQLGRLVVTDTTTSALHEYPLPGTYPNAGLRDVAIYAADSIWFTAPGVGRIGQFRPSLYGGSLNPFVMIPTGGEPHAITKGSGQVAAWFTEPASNRVGAYSPQTISNFLWYDMPRDSSGPYDVVYAVGSVWFTEELGQRVGRIVPPASAVYEAGVGNGALRGIAADSAGHVWFAEYDAQRIGEWRPPYLITVYLPLVLR